MFKFGDVVRICDDPSSTDSICWASPEMDKYKGAVGIICAIEERPSEQYPNGVYRLLFDGILNIYYYDGLWLSRVESNPVDTSELDAFFDEF